VSVSQGGREERCYGIAIKKTQRRPGAGGLDDPSFGARDAIETRTWMAGSKFDRHHENKLDVGRGMKAMLLAAQLVSNV